MQRPKGEKTWRLCKAFKGGEDCRGYIANGCVKNPKNSGEISKKVLKGGSQCILK